MDSEIYEVLFELAEEENDDLRQTIIMLKSHIEFLEAMNGQLVKEYDNLINPNKRLN